MDAEILNQLIWIKWLLAAIALAFVVIVGGVVWGGVMSSRALKATKTEKPFYERAKDLLDKGLHIEARALSEERIRAYPGDAHALWCHAIACYRLGEASTAIRSLRKAKELQPDWADSYVSPLIAAIESQGSTSSKAELRVITPNPSVNPDAPPGGAPVT
jgi:cytochrome c-type biogenesis protein CcmH/NrfG